VIRKPIFASRRIGLPRSWLTREKQRKGARPACDQDDLGHRIENGRIDSFNSVRAMEIVAKQSVGRRPGLNNLSLKSTDELNAWDMKLLQVVIVRDEQVDSRLRRGGEMDRVGWEYPILRSNGRIHFRSS